MQRTHNLISKGMAEKFSEATSKLQRPGEYVIVVRGLPRTLIMFCPDGCGEILTVNLDKRSGKAWRKFENQFGLTIYPSIWRDTGCQSHFIIWNNKILWCDHEDHYNVPIDEKLIQHVFNALDLTSFKSYEEIAEELKLIPWEALWACNELARRQCAIKIKQSYFRRIGNNCLPKPNSRIIDIRA